MVDPRLVPERLTPQIFTDLERWGWECRDTRTAADAYPVPAPVAQLGAPSWAGWASGQLSRIETRRARLGAYLIAAAVVTVVCAKYIDSFLALLPLVATGWLAWLMWGSRLVLGRRADTEHAAWLSYCTHQQGLLHDATVEWDRRRAEHDQRQTELLNAIPSWVPLRPSAASRMDVYGGNVTGWRALLTTAGASLLGSGSHVTVLDLSQESITVELVAAASQGHHPARVFTLPDQTNSTNVFAGLAADHVSAVLLEAAQSLEPGDSLVDRHGLAVSLEGMCDALAGRFTLARVTEALRILTDGQSASETVLTELERAALHQQRERPLLLNAQRRLGQLATVLATLSTSNPVSGIGFPDVALGELRVIELSPDRSTASTSVLAILLAHALTCHMANRSLPPHSNKVLIVVNADRLSRDHVESLDQMARAGKLRLVLMFRHLRGDVVDLLGGGEATLIMQLGNAHEAEQAATFIGKQHSLVASHFTMSRGHNESTASSREESHTQDQSEAVTPTTSSRGRWRRPRVVNVSTMETSESHGTNTGHATQSGTSRMESVSFERTYDYAVTPKTLQDLSPTAFILVDSQDANSPRLGDCDPEILRQIRDFGVDDDRHLRPGASAI